MKLGLGTAQFGLNYGISNSSGRTMEREVRKILELAVHNGISVIDTAAAYGDAESVLGVCLPMTADIRVVTKTIPLRDRPSKTEAVRWIRDGFARSLERLKLGSVDTLLVHHADDLLEASGDGVYAELVKLKQEGHVRRIGFSAYNGSQIDLALDRYDVDLVQLPINVFDQRLLEGGQLQRLRSRGVEVHVRSIFLQGLLLMDPSALPIYFDPLRSRLTAWRECLASRGLTVAQGALAFARSLNVDVIIVGVESAVQLEGNLADFGAARAGDLDFLPYAVNDERFVNPSLWRFPG